MRSAGPTLPWHAADTSGMILSIQLLRGIAALLVAVSHLPWDAYRQSVSPRFPDLTVCFFGVDLFFVVSGFVMVYASETGRGGSGPGTFLLRRVIRVVPLYWVFTTLVFTIAMWGDTLASLTQDEWYLVASSYALVPYHMSADVMDFYPMLSQGWTLEYEAFFYLCFAACLWLFPRVKVAVLAGGFAALCLAGALLRLPAPLVYYARTNTLEFVYGMALARLFLNGVRVPRWQTALAVATGAAGALAFAPFSGDWDALRGFGWGVPAALIVGGAVLMRDGGRSRLAWPFEVLGDASYSLYLVHDFIYDGIRHVATGNDDRTAPMSIRLFPVMLVAAVLAAILSYRLLERPMTRWLQHRLLGRAPLIPVRLPHL